ncbi:MAG TPA: ABC transporter permease [Candidatus Dormibacteraeota bacterium]|nr:ABC transporter permease [Candidatus Dormibacteraeota bacterium]
MTMSERLVALLDNPLIIKDAVSRMRSWRAPVILTIYLGLLGAFGYASFVTATVLAPSQRTTGSAQIGASVFASLAFIQLSLACLFAPALAAGAISGERERQTFDVLLVSRMTAVGIVWGKLVASVAFMLLLILSALPLFAAVFLFGGIDFEQFLVTQILTVSTAVSIGAVSLFLSAVFRRTLPSTVVAYGVAFAGTIGTLVAGLLFTFALAVRGSAAATAQAATDFHPLLFANPFYALFVVLDPTQGHPMHVGRLIQLLFFMTSQPSGIGPELEPWQAAVLVQIVLVVLAVVGAVQLVQARRAPMPSRLPEPVEAAAPEPPAGEEVAP